jgi:hypothetical protein
MVVVVVVVAVSSVCFTFHVALHRTVMFRFLTIQIRKYYSPNSGVPYIAK